MPLLGSLHTTTRAPWQAKLPAPTGGNHGNRLLMHLPRLPSLSHFPTALQGVRPLPNKDLHSNSCLSVSFCGNQS